MISDVQWEYCRVSAMEHEGATREEISFDCQVEYFAAADKTIEHQFTRLGIPVPFNTLTEVIRLLGERGWEMVSVQHLTYQRPLDPENPLANWWMSGIMGEAMAYFKRPVRFGRAIDEPRLPSY